MVSVYQGALLLGSATVGAAGNWTLKAPKLSDTIHVLTLSATDKAGNVGASAGSAYIGGSAADTLTGGSGQDSLLGGAGDDRLDGGAGHDRLTGGFGRDTFVFAAGQAGGDTVTDFAAGTDRLEFHGFNLASGTLNHLSGDDWQVSDGVTTEVLHLTGVTALSAADYGFV